MKTITVFDCNFLCQTVKMTVKKRMLAHNGKRTDVIYGFLRRILPLAETLKTDVAVFVWDSRDSIRKDIYPAYKASRVNRDQTEEEKRLNSMAYEQFDLLREYIIPMLGFKNNFVQPGYEGDDIMACLALNVRPKDKMILVTRDNDMLQCLRSNVVMYDPTMKKFTTEKSFVKKYGITPEKWGEVKAIAGCKSDEVAGVVGVAEKTAIKYLCGNLTGKKYMDIECCKQLIEDNRLLVKLPMLGCNTPEISYKKHFDQKQFRAVCTAYGMRSLLDQKFIDRWKKIFGNGRA